MTAVTIFLPSMAGTTGNTLWLHKSSDHSLVNTGGDALSETAASGWFSATVDEAWTETLSATVKDTNSLPSGYGWLAVGATQIVDAISLLDAATQTILSNLQTQVGVAVDNAWYLLAINSGAVATPQASDSDYILDVSGTTYTVSMAGQTSAGVRTAPTLTKV